METKKIPITKSSKIIKYLRNKYKEVRDLFTGNSKTLRKEYEYTNKWKAIPCSQIRKVIVKMLPLPKVIYTINAISRFPQPRDKGDGEQLAKEYKLKVIK